MSIINPDPGPALYRAAKWYHGKAPWIVGALLAILAAAGGYLWLPEGRLPGDKATTRATQRSSP